MTNVTNWIGIDDHADTWTICHLRGQQKEPAREWELQPSESGYRKLIGWLKELGGKVRIVYEAGRADTSCIDGSSRADWNVV